MKLITKLFCVVLAFITMLPATASAETVLKGWRESPLSIGVQVNATDPTLLAALEGAMTDWSASPVVDMSLERKGKIIVNQRDGGCIGCALITYRSGYISSVTIYIDPGQIATYEMSAAQVVCHELGHALGLVHQTNYNPPQSCLSQQFPGDHPNQTDYDALLGLYGS